MKKFISGFVLSALIFGSTTILAANGEIKALITDFKINLEGQVKPLKNKIISINGELYVSVKDISNTFGYQAITDKKRKTILVKNNVTSNTNTKDTQNTQSNIKIEIPDPALNKIIRDMIRKPSGDIYYNDISRITGIYAQGDGVESLDGLQYFNNLKEVQLGHAQLKNINVFSQMSQLTFIDLYDSGLTDISSLSGMTNLKTLNLAKNKISDITPLTHLSNLQFLTLSDNNVTDLTPLKNLTMLETLTLTNNPITDITPLKKLTGITNKVTSDSGFLTSKDNSYYRLPYRFAFKIGGKIYLQKGPSVAHLLIDTNNRLYLDQSGFGSIGTLLSLKYGGYTLSNTTNPFVDGEIEPAGNKIKIDYQRKFSNATDSYTEITIYNEDKSQSYFYRIKKGDNQGLIELKDNQLLLPLSDIFDKFNVRCTLEFDKANKLVIFSFN